MKTQGFLGRGNSSSSSDLSSQSHIDTTAFNAADARYLQTSGKGTMMYMAPEMWSTKKYDAFSTDIWAMGVILYLMLHGRYPFSINRLKTAIRAHRRGKIPIDAQALYKIDINRTDLSPGAVDLLEKIMSLDMNKRISLTGIMNHPWMCEVSRNDIRAVLKDDSVFAVRRQGWLEYHGHGAFGRSKFKRRYVTVGGQEIRMYYNESRAKLKNFLRINKDTKIELDEKSGCMTVISPNHDQYKDIKMIDQITFRCESELGLKAWRSSIEVEIRVAKNFGDVRHSTRVALSSGLETSSEKLRNKQISYDEYLKMRCRMFKE
jgi:serine/threonine protein kinase